MGKTLKQSITDDTTEEEMKSLRLEYESLEKKFSIVQSENANLIDMTETLRKETNEMKNDNDELKEKEKLLSQETLQKQKENEELRIKLIEAVQKRRDENPEEKGSDVVLKE